MAICITGIAARRHEERSIYRGDGRVLRVVTRDEVHSRGLNSFHPEGAFQ